MNEERFDEHRLNRAWERDDEAFLRAFVFPVEDRRLYMSEPWRGTYRWFRSPNVIPIEHWRRRRVEGGR